MQIWRLKVQNIMKSRTENKQFYKKQKNALGLALKIFMHCEKYK